MSSRLLSTNIKIEIYRTIILPVVLYGCETWSLTLREKHGLRVFDNRGLIFEPKREELQRSGEDYKTKSCITCNPQQILFGWGGARYERKKK